MAGAGDQWVADGIDALVQPMKLPSSRATANSVVGETRRTELGKSDHTVLAPGETRDSGVHPIKGPKRVYVSGCRPFIPHPPIVNTPDARLGARA